MSAAFDPDPRVLVTGLGIISSVGRGVAEFETALRAGTCGITRLSNARKSPSVRFGAVIPNFDWRQELEAAKSESPVIYGRARKILANTTHTSRLAFPAALQALRDAQLQDGSPALEETGLIVAGSNLSQAYTAQNWQLFSQGDQIPNPKYALSFFDSNIIGCLSEIFGLRGMGFTVGAASASGNAALFNAFELIRHGVLKRCLVLGACCDLSALELESFATLGAICTAAETDSPHRICRPFDGRAQGFVWGEGSACVILESAGSARQRGVAERGALLGASLLLDGNHLPDPNPQGEARAMRKALDAADLAPHQIGYINTHGTSSPLGDRTECAGIREVFDDASGRPIVNSTKGLTGHCLSAAGVIELIATLIQLNAGFVHPNLNLDEPIDPVLAFARPQAEPFEAEFALSNGFGFGGMNSSIVIRKAQK